MDWLFGKKKTPKQMMRENQRALKRAIRDLDRERNNMQKQEKKIIIDIKKAAKEGQMGSAKIMARDLVRTRKYIQKFYQMRTQLQGVSLRIQTMQSNQAMTEAMVGVTRAMRVMNGQINVPQLQRIMMEFERQSEMMDMKDEMMNDVIDDALDSEDDEEEESENILRQVLDDIGLDLDSQLLDAPSTSTAVATTSTADAD